MKKTIKVVGAIIENNKNEILCALRKSDRVLGNMWEFPGGKLEEGEDIFQCIIREIREELGVDFHIDKKEIFTETIHEYTNFIVHLYTIKGNISQNYTIKTEDHDAIIWLKKENLFSINWAPADIPAVEKLSDSYYTISKDILNNDFTDKILDGVDHILDYIKEGRSDFHYIWVDGIKLEISFINKNEYPLYYCEFTYKVYSAETKEVFLIDEGSYEIIKL